LKFTLYERLVAGQYFSSVNCFIFSVFNQYSGKLNMPQELDFTLDK